MSCGWSTPWALRTLKAFKPFSDALAWETEVWIAEMLDRMIHMDGDMFLGPRGAGP
jgi:hypothetical protein